MKLNITNRPLGELETEIMDAIWRMENASVRQVLRCLGKKKKKIAYTTVMTVMTRLAGKGILEREISPEGAYIYKPVQNREEFFAMASKKNIEGLLKEFGEVAIVQFAEIVERTDLGKLKEWRQKLKKIK